MLKVHTDAALKQSSINLKNTGATAVQVEQPAITTPGQPTTAAPAAGGDLLGEARKAIAAGAPKDKVIQRLKEKGVDASGL
jgi:hypothetical protein